MSDYQNVGGAWEKLDRNGDTFLSLKLSQTITAGIPLLIFKNKYKLNALDGRPDWIVYQPTEVPEEKTPDPF